MVKQKINKQDIAAILWSYVGCFVLTGGLIADLYFGMGTTGWSQLGWVSMSLFGVVFLTRDWSENGNK